MKLIVCLDDKNGMMFNKRRQSSDAELCRRILAVTEGNTLWMNGYTARLFADITNDICVDENFLEKASTEDYCFVENSDIEPYLDKIREITVFKWNRMYPADMRFPAEILDGWKLVEQVDFSGKSHKTITQEVYVR